MFSKSLAATVSLLAYVLSANAHTGITPALGISGTFTKSDSQRVASTNAPCGNADVASAIDSSTAVPVNADGTFDVTATNFNACVYHSTVFEYFLMSSVVVKMVLAQ